MNVCVGGGGCGQGLHSFFYPDVLLSFFSIKCHSKVGRRICQPSTQVVEPFSFAVCSWRIYPKRNYAIVFIIDSKRDFFFGKMIRNEKRKKNKEKKKFLVSHILHVVGQRSILIVAYRNKYLWFTAKNSPNVHATQNIKFVRLELSLG